MLQGARNCCSRITQRAPSSGRAQRASAPVCHHSRHLTSAQCLLAPPASYRSLLLSHLPQRQRLFMASPGSAPGSATSGAAAAGSSSVPRPVTTAAAGAAAGGAASAGSGEDPLVQYVVLRRDLWGALGWPLGSVVAQGCHASAAALWLSRDDAETREYCADENIDHMRKVVLEVASEDKLRALAAKLEAAGVPHKLWIEQPEDYATCLATAPRPRSALRPHFKSLQLCKAPVGGAASK